MAFKLGYCALRFKEPDLEKALAALKEAGWDGWECRLPLEWLGTPARVRKICDNAGLPMACLSAQGAPETPDRGHQERNRRRMDFAAEVGVDCFLFMNGRKPEGRPVTEDDLKRSAAAADAWADYAAQYGLELTYHIHTNLLVDSVDDWKTYMKHQKKARLCIDVSHAVLWGYDAVQSLKDFRSQLNYVHLQDYSALSRGPNGSYEPTWVPVGEARCLDFEGCAQTLKDQGFTRWVTACPGPPAPGADEIAQAKASASMYRYCRGAGY